MSRLHAVMASVEEMARHFEAEPSNSLTPPYEVIEGNPNLIVIEACIHVQDVILCIDRMHRSFAE